MPRRWCGEARGQRRPEWPTPPTRTAHPATVLSGAAKMERCRSLKTIIGVLGGSGDLHSEVPSAKVAIPFQLANNKRHIVPCGGGKDIPEASAPVSGERLRDQVGKAGLMVSGRRNFGQALPHSHRTWTSSIGTSPGTPATGVTVAGAPFQGREARTRAVSAGQSPGPSPHQAAFGAKKSNLPSRSGPSNDLSMPRSRSGMSSPSNGFSASSPMSS